MINQYKIQYDGLYGKSSSWLCLLSGYYYQDRIIRIAHQTQEGFFCLILLVGGRSIC